MRLPCCIQAVFQIRHTLSHNSGQMTQSDSTKLGIHGFSATPDGAIDPGEDDLGEAIFRFLVDQATDFTKWLETETAAFIANYPNPGTIVPVLKSRLMTMFVGSKAFDALNLIPVTH